MRRSHRLYYNPALTFHLVIFIRVARRFMRQLHRFLPTLLAIGCCGIDSPSTSADERLTYPGGKGTSKGKQNRDFEIVVQWMHERAAGNSGVFVWVTP